MPTKHGRAPQRRIPYAYSTATVHGGRHFTISAQRYRVEWLLVTDKYGNGPSRRHVPYTSCGVRGTSGETGTIGAKRESSHSSVASHCSSVSFEGGNGLARRAMPQ